MAGGYIALLIGVGMVIGTVVLRRGSKNWRAGYRQCRGILWDSASGVGSFGRFLLQFDPRREGGSSLVPQRYIVIEITPSNASEAGDIHLGHRKEMVIRLDCSTYAIGLGGIGFAGRNIPLSTCDNLYMLLDGEITSLARFFRKAGLFAGLREVRQIQAKIGPDRVLVRLNVGPPRSPANRQGGLAGLANNPAPGLAGGLLAVASGVAPGLGIIAGTLAGDALASKERQAIPKDQQQMRTRILGDPDNPGRDTLSSIAREFGWTIDAWA